MQVTFLTNDPDGQWLTTDDAYREYFFAPTAGSRPEDELSVTKVFKSR